MNKKYIYALFVMFLLVFSFSFVMAANSVTLDYPAADAEGLTGTIVVNSTLDTNALDLTNATFYYRIDNGGTPTAWVTIGSQIINVTNNQTNFNTTFDTTGIVDTINMTFNVTITNLAGGAVTTDSSINVSIDNGNPTATWSSASISANTNVDPGTSFTLGMDADNTIGIESCTAYYEANTVSIAAANEACSASVTCGSFGISGNVEPSILISVMDDNGDVTNSSSRSITCRGTGGGYTTVDFPTDIDTTKAIVTPAVEVTVKEGNFITNFFKSIIDWFKNIF